MPVPYTCGARNFLITVPADDLAPKVARSLAGSVLSSIIHMFSWLPLISNWQFSPDDIIQNGRRDLVISRDVSSVTLAMKIQQRSLFDYWWCLESAARIRCVIYDMYHYSPCWRHQMETFPALLALCVGNSPVTSEFPAQRPVTRSFDVSLICTWINGSVNNREAGDLRRHRGHYDVTVMLIILHVYD